MNGENWKEKYLKYKKKYIDLKNLQKAGVVPAAVFHSMGAHGTSSTSGTYRVPLKACEVSKKLEKDTNVYNTCALVPNECKQLFNTFYQKYTKEPIPSLKSTSTNLEINEAYTRCRNFVYGIVLMTLTLILITKNIYVFNKDIIPYFRDIIEDRKNNFEKCYNEFKRLNIVSGKEYIKKGTFRDSKINSLVKILEEHRLYTVGLNGYDVDRLPTPNQELTKDVLAHLILDFRLNYHDVLHDLNDPCIKNYVPRENYFEVKKIFEAALELKKEYSISGGVVDIDTWQSTIEKELKTTEEELKTTEL